MITALEQRNNFLLELIHKAITGGSGGAASNVNITGDAVGFNKEITQLQVLTELQRLANIEIDVDTINLNTDQLETILANILTRQADRTQFTNITDGTDTLAINADGSININGTVTVPANLVREQAPFNIENDIDVLRQEFQNGVYKNNVVEKQSLCVVRVVVDSPAVGDKTTYLGYNNNDYLSGGSVALIDNTYSIKRVVEFANGDVDMSWADGDRNNYTLIFDDGSQNYLTYGY